METACKFLQRKGFKKVYQPSKRYNLTISELVDFLEEYSSQVLNDLTLVTERKDKPPVRLYRLDR